MNCSKYRVQIFEHLRLKVTSGPFPPELASHFEKCVNCAAFQREQEALNAAFHSLRGCPEPLWSDQPPPQLLREFNARHQATYSKEKRTSLRLRMALAATTAAVLVIMTPLVINRATERKLVTHRPPRTSTTREEFVQLPYVAPLAPYEYEQVRRVTIPISTLLAYGVSVGAGADDGVVNADVVFGEDGRPLAVHVLTDSIATK